MITRRSGLAGVLALAGTLPRAGAASAVAVPRVVLETALGPIQIAPDVSRAPLSAGDFLRYVDAGLYADGGFYRVVRADNDTDAARIDVVQGGLLDLSKRLPPVAHETTAMTGLRHLDGTVSLARLAVGTGTAAAFFICVGDQPALDFGGARNPDGQGFAAFGRVLRGMEIVRTIWRMEAANPNAPAAMKGQMLTRPVRIARAYRET